MRWSWIKLGKRYYVVDGGEVTDHWYWDCADAQLVVDKMNEEQGQFYKWAEESGYAGTARLEFEREVLVSLCDMAEKLGIPYSLALLILVSD